MPKLMRADPGGGTLVISGWGCAAGTLEPLAYTRASSAEFCYPILEFLKSLLSYTSCFPETEFWHLIISDPVAFYDCHLSTLLRLSRENLNLPISFSYIFE